MTRATDEVTGDGAPAPTPTVPVASRERTGMADDTEEMSTAVAHERGSGNNTDADAPATGGTAAELMTLLRGVAGQQEAA
ncbi:uncharacterized protein PITG_12043 [Phytophthora infestans T30-4]|uniref:Uncharacterized protein n=1 Tax=Phytophthora infestans (strain T30-4) TaxID=403677 RepID=D0NHS6_PHYIT|nr:uncharacterized protein PITG_12043 [Phytophthora infestans T30-4]EEY59001.1 hypothetical protein PITG_12043 [Phytophthora infestans T30-4]|eukprot:XP_002901474.1 hypothetical protein PITG_12043 [Phytophthora infestans T30-4]